MWFCHFSFCCRLASFAVVLSLAVVFVVVIFVVFFAAFMCFTVDDECQTMIEHLSVTLDSAAPHTGLLFASGSVLSETGFRSEAGALFVPFESRSISLLARGK